MLIANRPITTPQTAVATTPILLTNGAFRSADVQANFVTAGGGLTANTALSGLAGNMWRALISSTGTYAAGTNLRIDLVPRGPYGASAT
jgi:hypothetical protein